MNENAAVEAALAQMFGQAQRQSGDGVKSYWFNDSDACPGCSKRIDVFKVKGRDSMSLNTFINRERHVLIGYFLCSRCVKKVFQDAKRNPGQETERHATIERNLIKAYQQHRNSLH